MYIDDPYESQAWRDYEGWLATGSEAGAVTRSLRVAGRWTGKALTVARDAVDATPLGPMVDRAEERTRAFFDDERFETAMNNILKALGGTYEAAVDTSLRTVRPARATRHYEEYVGGRSVATLRQLPLRTLDDERPAIHGYYRAQLAVAAGATGGAVGLSITGPQFAVVMAADVVATIGLSVRGIATHLAHYGYDVTKHTEHAYVMTLLQTAMSETAAERTLLTQQARNLALGLAKGRAWSELNKNALTQLSRQGFKVVSERMTKRKLALVLPGLSAAIGLGQGYNHGRQVMDAAYYEGRARLLRDRWGDGDDESVEVLEVTPDD